MADEPEAPTPELDDDEYVATLQDDRARRVLEARNGEAATRRHEAREARAAQQKTSQQLSELRERFDELQREHESKSEREAREIREAERQRIEPEYEHAMNALKEKHGRELATLVIKAKAAEKFADPEDAVRLLPMDQLLAIENEDERMKRIEAELDKMLERKPYLARERTARPPLVTQGGRSDRPDGRTRDRERSWLSG